MVIRLDSMKEYKFKDIEKSLSYEELIKLDNVLSNKTILNSSIKGATIIGGSVTMGTGDSCLRQDVNGIYLGNSDFASAPFSVDMDGNLIATSANISGTITATAGVIGGWTIGLTTLYTVGIILDAGNQRIQVGAGSEIMIDGASQYIQSSNYVSGVFGAGFHLDSNLLEVGNIAVRGMIRTAVFQKDVISTVGGNLAVLDGDVLEEDMSADDVL